MDAATLLSVLVLAVCAFYSIEVYISGGRDAREPPLVKPRFPLFGHAFGIIQHGTGYYGKLTVNARDLMYSLQIFNIRIYVTNSTDLLNAVQRAAKTVSFRPFGRLTVERFSEASRETLDLCDAGGEYEGDGTFVRQVDMAMHKALSPGPALDKMNLDTALEVVRCLDELGDEPVGQSVDLYAWVKDAISIASTRGTYGPMNPYQFKGARDAFWTFENDSAALLLGMRRLVPKGYKASQAIAPFFEEYVKNRGYEQASALTQGRMEVFISHNCPVREMARLEWPLTVAILSNTVPASFWTLYEVFSRPELLAEIRARLADAVTTTKIPCQAERQHVLDLAKVKTDCKILLGTFQEMQRARGRAASIRKVMADTTLENKYLLRKGSYLQLPTEPVHHDPSIWGADAAVFNPHRFENPAPGAPKLKSTSLLAWGFAPHMCPARQFATAEILVFVALVVLRFDVVPVGGAGWEGLETTSGAISTVPPPKKDIQVLFRKREEWQGKWSVNVGQSASRFALVSG